MRASVYGDGVPNEAWLQLLCGLHFRLASLQSVHGPSIARVCPSQQYRHCCIQAETGTIPHTAPFLITYVPRDSTSTIAVTGTIPHTATLLNRICATRLHQHYSKQSALPNRYSIGTITASVMGSFADVCCGETVASTNSLRVARPM